MMVQRLSSALVDSFLTFHLWLCKICSLWTCTTLRLVYFSSFIWFLGQLGCVVEHIRQTTSPSASSIVIVILTAIVILRCRRRRHHPCRSVADAAIGFLPTSSPPPPHRCHCRFYHHCVVVAVSIAVAITAVAAVPIAIAIATISVSATASAPRRHLWLQLRPNSAPLSLPLLALPTARQQCAAIPATYIKLLWPWEAATSAIRIFRD
ncbi:hypothetical protein BC827DRAFT_1233206, partial [Russula dissimulans]